MDEVKTNCGNWIDYAYAEWLGWIRREKKEQYYLGEFTEIYVERMRNALLEAENGNALKKEEAWNLLERLKKLGTNIHGMKNDFGGDKYAYEQAAIHLECAIVAYKMGDVQEAASLLLMPISSFHNRTLPKAVSCWIYGCIQWQSQTHLEEALINWEKSHQIVTEMAASNSFEQAFAQECDRIANEMSRAILTASRQNYPPPPPGYTASTSSSPRTRSTPKPQSSRMGLFPVLGSIPAGSPVEFVDDSNEKAASDGFNIHGQFYKTYNLKTGSEININQNHRYFLLKVNGDSMNNAVPINIEDRDYVLVVKQDAAETGDIVAAEIKQVDREATLKRYSFKNGEYGLFPESRNPANIPLTYKKDFYILGKVVAVLKRDG